MSERRSCSTVDELPEDIKGKLDVRLMNRAYSYHSNLEWLEEQGHKISYGAIWRYAKRQREVGNRICESLQRTYKMAAIVAANPDLDYTKAANILLMDGLMQKVASAEEEFLEMPLDKAGRLIASLSRNATYEQRVRQDMKKKAELAFEQMESELMAVIKQDKELSTALRDILTRAKERVLKDENS